MPICHAPSNKRRKVLQPAASNKYLVDFIFAAGLIFCESVSSNTLTAASFPARLPSTNLDSQAPPRQKQSSAGTTSKSGEVNVGSVSQSRFWGAAASVDGVYGGGSDDDGGTDDEASDKEEPSISGFVRIGVSGPYEERPSSLESVVKPEKRAVSSECARSASPPGLPPIPPRLPQRPPKANRIPTKSMAPIGSQPLQTLEKLQQMLDETDYLTANRQTTTQRSQLALSDEAAASSDPRKSPSADSGHQQMLRQPDKLWTSRDRAKYQKQQQRLRRADRTAKDAGTMAEQSPNLPKRAEFSAVLSREEEDYSDDTDDGLGYSLPDFPVFNSDAEDEGEASAAGEESSSSPTAARRQDQQHQKLFAHPHASIQGPQQQGYRYPSAQSNSFRQPYKDPTMEAYGGVAGTTTDDPGYTAEPPRSYHQIDPQKARSLEQQFLMQQRQHQYSQFVHPGSYSQQTPRPPPLLQSLPFNGYRSFPLPPNQLRDGYPGPHQYPPLHFSAAQRHDDAEHAAWAAANGYVQIFPDRLYIPAASFATGASR